MFWTQWWLHGGEKPDGSICTPGTEEAVVESLKQTLADAGERRTVVVGHHPLVSSGPHGGYFNWQDHLFPVTRVWAPMWIPLPIVGSGYPLMRRAGVSSQDISGSKNERMRSAFEEAFASHPPLVYAAGHEHTPVTSAIRRRLGGETKRSIRMRPRGSCGSTCHETEECASAS